VDQLGLEQAVDGFGEGVVVAVADAADRRLDAGLEQALGVADRDVLGELNWSSQHLEGGRYDDRPKTAFGAGGRNCRFTRSSGQGADRSLCVVFTVLPRTAPARPICFMRRAT